MVNKKSSPLRKEFAENIRKFRMRSGLTQEQLAGEAKLHRTYIGTVERGEQNISIDNIYKIAKALKIPAKELLTTS